ncbi:putative non-specific lipid-transfer protein 14 [Lactuca sativa]|uniref:putative non-specific lipid-transfer protein 14 n=1 Tax=Lactuca sativa TaxID=4236 RepID=UPI000CD86323|nr:putative non-specific lipid-transfer protein 14 [Lactuca sativa]
MMKMVSLRVVIGSWLLVMVVVDTVVVLAVDCITVAALLSTCSEFVNNETKYPYLGSSCCKAMTTLGYFAYNDIDRHALCFCFIGVINATYTPDAANAFCTLPGFCGVSLGFLTDPTTECG